MSRKAVFTSLTTKNAEEFNVLATYNDNIPYTIDIITKNDCDIVGNIYVAHVNDLVKGINAAFVEFDKGHIAYMSLFDCTNAIFTNRKNTSKVCQGDNILVQISKEPIKTKDAVATPILNFTEKYSVLIYGETKSKGDDCTADPVSVSKKITDSEQRVSLSLTGKEIFAKVKSDIYEQIINEKTFPLIPDEVINNVLMNLSLIIRTEANSITSGIRDILYNEISSSLYRLFSIISKAMSSKPRTCIYKSQDRILTTLINNYSKADDLIITDNSHLYDRLIKENVSNVSLYRDELLPLHKLYNIEGILDDISSKKVWLKSGGYLIFDYTEALTVIDVNTGKCQGKKNTDDTFFKVNMEAADEILRQLSLRNISGIIIVDFIDMKSDSYRQMLFSKLKETASRDPVKTVIVDVTKLNLVEITRKKIRERVKVPNNY